MKTWSLKDSLIELKKELHDRELSQNSIDLIEIIIDKLEGDYRFYDQVSEEWSKE